MEKKVLTPMQKGLLLSLILIVYAVALYILVPNLNDQKPYSWAASVLFIAGIVWACYTYANDMKGNVTFGNVFAHGFKVTAIVTSIYVIYTILSITVLFPEIKDKAIEAAYDQMEKQGNLSESQIDQAVEMTRKFFMPFAIGGALIGNLIVGVIGALIGAAVAKKNPNPTPFETDAL